MNGRQSALAAAVALLVTGFSGASAANNFPTLARVEYVMACMNRIGVQTYDTMYRCVCAVDQIAERLSYDDFAEAQTYAMLRSTPGEKGGLFRDPDRSKELRTALAEASDMANARCSLPGERN